MNNNSVLQKEFEYFINNLSQLAQKYQGKFIVIKNGQVLGAYDTFDMAIIETKKTEELGTFLIQKCDVNSDNYTQTYHSRVKFIN